MDNLFSKFIRSYAKVSKENLKKYLSYFSKEVKTTTSDTDAISENSECVKCEYRFRNKIKDTKCLGCINNNAISNCKIKETRLSKSQLIQIIAYHFLPLSATGEMEFVSEDYVAHLVGGLKACNKNNDLTEKAACLKTIARNNEKLASLGLIEYKKVEAGIFSLKIKNYSDAFNTKEKGGKGFLPMPLNFFKKLRKINNVNNIRLALDAYEIYYSSSYNHEDEYMHQRLLSRFKKVLSKNSSHRKAIFNLFNNLTDIFTIEQIKANQNDNKVSRLIQFKVNNEYRCNNFDKKCITESTNKVCDILDSVDVNLSAEAIDDLIDMSIQYGTKVIEKAIKEFDSLKDKASIKNVGGFIRGLIKRDYYTFIFSDLM